MRTISLEEFHNELRAQGVPKIHLAFVCPVCNTMQSAHDLIQAKAGKNFDEVQTYLGFSCVGRFTNAGPYIPSEPPASPGCDLTLGGLLRVHKLEVMDEGQPLPRFEIANPVAAFRHALQNGFDFDTWLLDWLEDQCAYLPLKNGDTIMHEHDLREAIRRYRSAPRKTATA